MTFGAGIRLDTDWDFIIDTSGDIDTISDDDELQKDIAFFSASLLQDQLGKRISPTTLQEIEVDIRRIMLTDDRIDSVVNVEAREKDSNTAEIIATIQANGDVQELVFEL